MDRQRITTREQLDELPLMTAVRDPFGAICTKVTEGDVMGWVRVTTAIKGRGYRHYHPPFLPAEVLVRGDES